MMVKSQPFYRGGKNQNSEYSYVDEGSTSFTANAQETGIANCFGPPNRIGDVQSANYTAQYSQMISQVPKKTGSRVI